MIRVSAASDVIEFSRKDHDEDRARSWFNKEKSAFVHDQAPASEKCFDFGDLLMGPAQNWYRQLSRSTRSDGKGLAKSFQIRYCGHGSTEARREHIDHFIDLASQLALPMIPDAGTLDETLRSQDRGKARQSKMVYESIRRKPKAPARAAPSDNARAVGEVCATANSSESYSETSGSEGEGDVRKAYLAADVDRSPRSESDRRANTKTNTHQEGHQFGQLNGE
ncbi:unnamed protein product [Phytophthora fragariaefolia]|uniref:Unnamed protein product n=1 Tax=Phytophthora fragariaefolia TaxID=1490495 RepID=A0A9W6Y9V1_9STRA|nr:unnamed protein product [Phytophthora fragariaefolia]